MAKRKVIALDQQRPIDIALQEHGSVEALLNVMADDAAIASLSAALTPGQSIEVKSEALSPDVSRFFAARKHKPVTGKIEPIFFCVGPQHLPIEFVEAGAGLVNTTTGYLAIRQGGELVVAGDGTPGDVGFEHEAGAACIYSCDEEGESDGGIISVIMGATAKWWSFKWLPDLQALQVLVGTRTTIDLRSNPLLEFVEIYGDAGPLKQILLPEGNIVFNLRAIGFGISNTDQVINRLDADIAGGELYLADGSTPRTAASEDNYDALAANTWTLNVP